jgi:RNA polymerase sigma-70 factor (ECF subfamily)
MKDLRQDPSGGNSTTSAASISSSLLERLRDHDAEAWKRLVRLYYPLVRGWCLRGGLRPEDAADVAQEVFRALAGNVHRFRREESGSSFRGWLYGITNRQLLAHRRRQKQQAAGVGGSEAQQWFANLAEADVESASSECSATAPNERHELLRRALQLLRGGVAKHTWEAFWRTAVEGESPSDIAADLGISVNTVYVAKARLLGRLREEFGELIE